MQELRLPPGLEERCEALGRDFLVRFYETELGRRPGNLQVLVDLGHLYTELGRFDDGLAIDRRLATALPEDPTVVYNLACSLALTGSHDEAFEALASAVDLGYDDVDHLRADGDLDALRGDPRFATLLERLADGA